LKDRQFASESENKQCRASGRQGLLNGFSLFALLATSTSILEGIKFPHPNNVPGEVLHLIHGATWVPSEQFFEGFPVFSVCV
jgi:hypothetical protein